MLRFFKTLSLFLLPLAILLTPGFFVLLASGEFAPLSSVENRYAASSTTPVLYGPAYSNFLRNIAVDMVAREDPSVVALGSSRVGQFRAALFKDPSAFYNASGAVGAMSDFKYFLGTLPQGHAPSILIVAMDQYYFDPARLPDGVIVRPSPFSSQAENPADLVVESYIRTGGWWKVYDDYLHGKFTLKEIFEPEGPFSTLGLEARADDDGFLDDGSHYVGAFLGSPQEQASAIESISAMASSTSDTSGYEYGTSISPEAISELDQFLALAKAENIYVIGFLPPLPHAVYQAMKTFPQASYADSFDELPATLEKLYASYGFDFFDMSDPASVGGSDSEMLDPNHGSEKLYAQLFLAMTEKDPRLSAIANSSLIKEKLGTATSTYEIFTPEELSLR